MTRLTARGKVIIRMMVTLLVTLVVVGVIQYAAADRVLTNRALAQLASAHDADAKVIRSLYEASEDSDRLSPVRENCSTTSLPAPACSVSH